MPHLPARDGPQRLHPRHDQELLVGGAPMSMTDPVADFLTRIRNGIMAAHEEVEIPASKLKTEMARILTDQGYIEGYETRPGVPGDASEKIVARLKYTGNRTAVISGLRRGLPPGPRTARGRRAHP